jgi:GT2 family glycosyltransferase
MNISIVVPVYNGGSDFQKCLAALQALSPAPYEIIVVADGDTDGSRYRAEAIANQVLINETPQGPAMARNRGAKAANGDLLFFVDADVVVPSTILQQINDLFTKYRDLTAVIGSYDDMPGDQDFLSQYRNLLHHYTHQQAQEDAATFWGACGVVRRDIFLQLGGFDQAYHAPSIEDIEFGVRLKQAGYTIRLVKDLQVKHLKRWTVQSLLKTDFFARAVPWSELIVRNGKMPNDLNLRLSHRISVVSVFGLLGTLLLALRRPVALMGTSALAVLLLILNHPVYAFFQQKRGWRFAVQTVFWHWLYYGYSGAAFGLVLLRFFLTRLTAKSN